MMIIAVKAHLVEDEVRPFTVLEQPPPATVRLEP